MRISPPPDRVTDAQLSVDRATIVTEGAPVPKFHQARTITAIELHESDTFVKLTLSGADLFA